MIKVEDYPQTHYMTVNGTFVPVDVRTKLEELKDYVDSVNILDGGLVNTKMLGRKLQEIIDLVDG